MNEADRAVLDPPYGLIEKITYTHRNPVRRDLAPTPPAWPWSSAAAYAGHLDAPGPPIAFDLLPPLTTAML